MGLLDLLAPDALPAEHGRRQARVAERIAKIESHRAAETERLNAALAALQRQAAADARAEKDALERIELQQADRLAAEFVPALTPLFAAWQVDDRRPSLLALAEPLRSFDARSRTEPGCELQPMLVAAAAAGALINANAEAASAFTGADSLSGDALSSAARLLRAAVANADASTLEGFAYALEAALQKQVRYNGGRQVSEEQRAAWSIVQTSGRRADAMSRLAALSATHGKARQAAFESWYTPSDEPIVPHPSASSADEPAV